MLGNQVELWLVMLGVMKVGGVIMPTTTAVGPVGAAVIRGGWTQTTASARASDSG